MSKPLQKDALWSLYVARNPHWVTDGASFTAEGLRKFFDQAFEMGHRLGVENGRALEAKERDGKDKGSSLFDVIFGRSG